jgi:uncharacterized protein YneF (UPF0154 family)
MNNWNTTGWLKALLVVLIAVPFAAVPAPNQPSFDLFISLLAFLFGGLFMYFVTRYNLFVLDRQLTEPIWNDHPFSKTTPLAFFQFMGWIILGCGIGLTAGTALKQNVTSSFGIVAIAFGFGMILGMYLVARRRRNELN